MENREISTRPELLARAHRCWDAMAAFREERERCKRFTYGDQWSDTVPTAAGDVKEEDYIRAQGNIPLKNNLIRRLVRNVLGVFRNQWRIPECVARDPAEEGRAGVMQRLLEYNMELNRMEEMYARTMEEFLISGMAVHRKWFGRKGRLTDCWTDFVSPENFFVDTDSRDFRGWDFGIVGQLHDLDFATLTANFSDGGDPERLDLLRKLYSPLESGVSGRTFGFAERAGDFSTPVSPGLCRVVEVWTRETIVRYRCHDPLRGEYYRIEASDYDESVEKESRRRRALYGHNRMGVEAVRVIEEEWYWHYIAPDGTLLGEGVTPYAHGSHPYIVKAYPFIDGEIHSFVSDIIDQQKFTNRLISMYDWILRASAKGVLLFPEGALPEGVEISDVAEEWSRFNGVIVFRPRAGVPLPQQISSNTASAGITELLDIQMKMMEDISGVNGALQGRLDSSTMSGTLYDSQTRNSLTALADLLKSYRDFILDATAADASNIRQFYDNPRLRAILGQTGSLETTRDFFDTVFDFSIRESARSDE